MRSPEPASIPIVANLRVSSSVERASVPKELASGVDALYLSGNGYLSKGFLARLDEERMFADRASRPVPFELGDLILGFAPHGWGKYRFCLGHETGRIGFTASRRLPTVRIQPRAEFLHAAGPEGTVRHFAEILRPFVEGLVLSVAPPRPVLRHGRDGFVCRGPGRLRVPGRRDPDLRDRAAGHRVQLRVEAEAANQRPPLRQDGRDDDQGHRLVGADLGGAPHPGSAGVAHRVRDRAGRTQRPRAAPPRCRAGRRTVAVALLHGRVAHAALADGGLQPFPLAARRSVGSVQSATLAHGGTELHFIRQHKRASSIRRLRPVLVGYLVAFALWAGTTDLQHTLEALSVSVGNDEIVRRMTFAERVERRRAEGGYR